MYVQVTAMEKENKNHLLCKRAKSEQISDEDISYMNLNQIGYTNNNKM